MKQSEFVSLVKDTFEKNGYTKVRERSRKLDKARITALFFIDSIFLSSLSGVTI